jgi:hypothetical protein
LVRFERRFISVAFESIEYFSEQGADVYEFCKRISARAACAQIFHLLEV